MRRRWLFTISILAGLALSAFGADEAFATRRVALIIGNAKYEHAGVLANTLNDAHAVATLLKQAKFDVVDERDDLGVVEMKRVVRDFAATASNADISVIYYSGHGMEAAGVNYLVPVDARLANADDVEDETLPLDRLLWASSSARSLSLIILDACRENPFLSGGAAVPVTRGVAAHPIGKQATSANTLIAYAAKAGSVSFDGAGLNSPFTTALVKHIAEPGVDIRIAFGRVRDDVLAATGNQQEPFVYGSLGGETVSLSPAVAKVQRPARRDGRRLCDGRADRHAGRLPGFPSGASRGRLLRRSRPRPVEPDGAVRTERRRRPPRRRRLSPNWNRRRQASKSAARRKAHGWRLYATAPLPTQSPLSPPA